MLFDLLRESKLLRRQAQRGVVGFSLDHDLREPVRNKKKNIDLVVCTPAGGPSSRHATASFHQLLGRYGMVFDDGDRDLVSSLPALPEVPVGDVLVAFEVKAAMTAHVRAIPRLFDELDGSHSIIHGSAASAIAVGLLIVNAATRFVSPDRNRHDHRLIPPVVSRHNQPSDASRVMEKMKRLPRASHLGVAGYEAFAMLTVECVNDGSPINLVDGPPAPPHGDPAEYASVIASVARIYEERFARI